MNKGLDTYGVKSAKVVQAIEIMTFKGTGTEKDPVRNVKQYWDFDGNLLAENDD